MKMGISKIKPIQIMVLRNLVSKLKKGNNHRYADLVKDISSLFKNELGQNKLCSLTRNIWTSKENNCRNPVLPVEVISRFI